MQCFEGLSPGAPLGSGTMRSQHREQRVAATKKSPTALLCFGPSNAIPWAGQEGIALGITEVGVVSQGCGVSPTARKKPLPMDTAPSDHSLCPAISFSEFLLLLSRGNLSYTEALKKAERSAGIQKASCPLAADEKAIKTCLF